MTAHNSGAHVLVFQGNDGIHQSMLRSFRASFALPSIKIDIAQRQGREEKKAIRSEFAAHSFDISMQIYSEIYFIFRTHQKLQIRNHTWQQSVT